MLADKLREDLSELARAALRSGNQYQAIDQVYLGACFEAGIEPKEAAEILAVVAKEMGADLLAIARKGA